MTRLSRRFEAALVALAALAGAIVAAVAIVIPVDATVRFAFGRSINGIVDVIEFGLMSSVFLAAPWVLHRHGHVAVEIFAQALPERSKEFLGRVVSLIGCGLSVVMAWYGMTALLASYEKATMVRKAIIFPEWWTFVPLAVCFALMAVEFLRQFAGRRAVVVERVH